MISVTEVLRRMLDERVVHWWVGEDERKTLWESNGLTWEYFNDENGDAWLGFLGACEQDITPEQAVEVTLGPAITTVDETETLHARGDTWGTKEFDKKVVVHVMECSACGHTYEHVNGDYEYCPHCRAKIVHTDE